MNVSDRINEMVLFVENEINEDNAHGNAHAYYRENGETWEEIEIAFTTKHVENYKRTIEQATKLNGLIMKTDPFTLAVTVRFDEKY